MNPDATKNKKNPFVSIVIPVLNNSEGLERCLTALKKQTYPTNFYEVIVIDNGSTEDIEKVTNKFSYVILDYEEKVGSYAARNKGIAIAKGEIIAFTDSDCIPDLGWISNGVKKIESTQNCGFVGGHVEMLFRKPDRLNFIEFFDVEYLNQKRTIKNDKYASTANMFTYAQIFTQVGIFNDSLKSAGDKEWGQRVFSQGFTVVYAGDSIVKHPSRETIVGLYKKTIRILGGQYDLENLETSDASHNPQDSKLFKRVIQDLKPSFSYLRSRSSDSRLKGIHQKVAYVCLVMLIRYAVALELMRLRFGGHTRR